MEIFSEGEVKYLAGLLDANGSLSFKFAGKGLYLEMDLSASSNTDRHGYIKSIADRIGTYNYREEHSIHTVKLASRRDLNLLIPRVVKHMVVKGAHWDRLFNKYTELKGADIRGSELELKEFSEKSRAQSGPIKPKIHPTWAWVAGYMDGDGSYIHKKYGKRHTVRACISTTHADMVGVELLHKAFGGQIKFREDRPNSVEWIRALGKGSTDFAIPFLKKVHKHSRLKKHRIECILSFHNALATTK